MNETAFIIGSRPITWAEIILAVSAAIIVLLLIVLLLTWRALRQHKQRQQEEARLAMLLQQRIAELSGQLSQQADAASARDTHIARLLSERLDAVSMRLGQGLIDHSEHTARQLRELAERLAVIDEARAHIGQLAGEVTNLQRILSDKQARGAFGQGRMEAIVRDALPRGLYAFQDTLSNGARPDCTIRMPESDLKLVIDAKFPLEGFDALHRAEDETARQDALRRIRRDMRRHIADIAGKYLIPGETLDFAILFVPSESLYAELHERMSDLVQEAHRAHVVIASPSVLMLMVQTLQTLFRDVRMREAAGIVQREVRHLLQDVERLHSRLLDLQRHFGQVTQDIDRLRITGEKIINRALKIDALDLDEEEKPGRSDGLPPDGMHAHLHAENQKDND